MLAASVFVLGALLLGADAKPCQSCTPDSCLQAVQTTGSYSADPKGDCSSYLAGTVIPSTTATVTVTATLLQTSVSLEASIDSIFSTQTNPTTVTEATILSTTSVATDLETTIVTDIISTTVPAIVTQTVLSTEITVVTVTETLHSTATVVPVKRAVNTEASDVVGTSSLFGIPTYAAACQDASAYSRACRCIGAKATTVTAAEPTTTVTVTQTQVYTTDSIVPSSVLVVVTAMPTSTLMVTSVTTIVITSTVQVTQTTDVLVSITSTSTSTDYEPTTITSTATVSTVDVSTTTAIPALPTFTLHRVDDPSQYVTLVNDYILEFTTTAADATTFSLDSDGYLSIPSLGYQAAAGGGSNSYNLGLVFDSAEDLAQFELMELPTELLTFVLQNGQLVLDGDLFAGYSSYCLSSSEIFFCDTAAAPAGVTFYLQYTLV